MGLFTRRRERVFAARESWQHDGGEVTAASGDEMFDEGCAGESAYGVTFVLDSAPGATITVWFYPVFAAPGAPGDFQVGWRCDYIFGGGRLTSAPWTHTAYGMDAPDFFDDLDHADGMAQWWASALAADPRPGSSERDPAVFCWDGQPWDGEES